MMIWLISVTRFLKNPPKYRYLFGVLLQFSSLLLFAIDKINRFYVSHKLRHTVWETNIHNLNNSASCWCNHKHEPLRLILFRVRQILFALVFHWCTGYPQRFQSDSVVPWPGSSWFSRHMAGSLRGSVWFWAERQCVWLFSVSSKRFRRFKI